MDKTKVKVDLSFTVKLAEYQFFKVELGIEDWVREGETASSATDRVYSLVEGKMIEKVDETREDLEAHIKRKK